MNRTILLLVGVMLVTSFSKLSPATTSDSYQAVTTAGTSPESSTASTSDAGGAISAAAGSGANGSERREDDPVSVQLPAFPGADGWGATALAECRSMPIQVLAVSNTNSEGPGSLAQAIRDVRSDHFTFIVFRTGGRISVAAGGIRLAESCLYLAGQTAPGDGIVIAGRGTSFWFRGYGGNINDVVVRYLRFRGRDEQTRNNLIIAKGERIVLDHMSFSWADNYLLALIRYGGMLWSAPIADVSIQNSVFAEALARHPTAFVLGTNGALKNASVIDMKNISVHRNLMAHNSHRNPLSAADNALVANNVIYNWRQGVGMMNVRGKVDWVNNFAKAGPMTRSPYSYVVNPQCVPDLVVDDFDIYAAGNIGPRSDQPDGDNWNGRTRQVACYYKSGAFAGQEVPARWRRDAPQNWANAPFPMRLLPARTAYDSVLDDVGANARLTCDGHWVSALDDVDRRLISDARNGTGPSLPPANEGSVGGWPTYVSGTPCQDTDGDHLPDAWEQRFYDCATCADPATVGREGYLLIEHYLNGTSPR